MFCVVWVEIKNIIYIIKNPLEVEKFTTAHWGLRYHLVNHEHETEEELLHKSNMMGGES